MIPYPPFFPQPQGNVYTVNNSMEVANIPTTSGISVAICLPEDLMFLKTMQDGKPSVSTYRISSYEKEQIVIEDLVKRIENLEKGGQSNEKIRI